MSEIKIKRYDSLAEQDGITYEIFIPKNKLMTVKLDKMDQALMQDIDENRSKSKTPAADIILGLETLLRRIEEQTGQGGQESE